MRRPRPKTQAEKDADHDKLEWLIEHLDAVPGPPVEWSDGNKLRYLVYNRFASDGQTTGGCEAIHDNQVGWDLLRIADRLDALDAAEMQMPVL